MKGNNTKDSKVYTMSTAGDDYAKNLSTQLRKGFVSYCVLVICDKSPHYTGDIITSLRQAEMVVVEGTIYPLLSRLQRDGLLDYEWQESEQGPPRKYYKTTELGRAAASEMKRQTKKLNTTLNKLEKGYKK